MNNFNQRADFAAIANWIAPSTQVLDLGCGDGSFLEFLQKQKPVHTYGVEIDDSRVLSCVQKGLNAVSYTHLRAHETG
jgi:methionine biosynthesis protein MetW